MRGIKEAEGNPDGNLIPSINIHRDSQHCGATMGGIYHYLCFIKVTQNSLVLQVKGFITGTEWVLIGCV